MLAQLLGILKGRPVLSPVLLVPAKRVTQPFNSPPSGPCEVPGTRRRVEGEETKKGEGGSRAQTGPPRDPVSQGEEEGAWEPSS